MSKTKKHSSQTNLMIHSEAKLELYQTYLERYLAILGVARAIGKINIYDLFCGTGIYDNGKQGSPILAFRTIKEHRKFFKEKRWKQTPITLTINDGVPSNINNVRSYLNPQNENEPCCTIQYYSKDFFEVMPIVQGEIDNQSWNERNLVFIDPYGYKEIRMHFIEKLMESNRSEIILFLPVHFMYRFFNVAIKEPKNPSYQKLYNFILDAFPEGHPIRQDGAKSEFYLIKMLKEAFSFSGKYFTTSYYIDRGNGNYYALFFITSNILGFERILGVKWDLDESGGMGFTPPGPQYSLFNEVEKKQLNELNKATLRHLIVEKLKVDGPMTNLQLYKFTLENEYLPKHAFQVLKELKSEKLIIVLESGTGKILTKSNFYISYENFKHSKLRVTISLR